MRLMGLCRGPELGPAGAGLLWEVGTGKLHEASILLQVRGQAGVCWWRGCALASLQGSTCVTEFWYGYRLLCTAERNSTICHPFRASG